jgi:hypothetical protein
MRHKKHYVSFFLRTSYFSQSPYFLWSYVLILLISKLQDLALILMQSAKIFI